MTTPVITPPKKEVEERDLAVVEGNALAWCRMDILAAAEGLTVTEFDPDKPDGDRPENVSGYFDPQTRTIGLQAGLDVEDKALVLGHELAHFYSGRAVGVMRDRGTDAKTVTLAADIAAELTSHIVCRAFGGGAAPVSLATEMVDAFHTIGIEDPEDDDGLHLIFLAIAIAVDAAGLLLEALVQQAQTVKVRPEWCDASPDGHETETTV